MSDIKTNIQKLKESAQEFAQERNWGQFHTIKNLAANLSVESNELLEIFTWKNDAQSEKELQERRSDIEDEVGDVLLTLLLFCDRAGIDLSSAYLNKLEKTKKKYPADQFHGKSKADSLEAQRRAKKTSP